MLLHNHPEYVSCACGYNAVNYDAKSLNTHRTTLKTNDFPSPPPSPSFELVSISLGYLVPDFRAPIYPRWRSQRSRLAPNMPALHAKTQGATRVQQYAC